MLKFMRDRKARREANDARFNELCARNAIFRVGQ